MIYAGRIRFPVTWIVEGLSDPIVQTDLSSAFTPQLAWQHLRVDRNDLYEFMTFNCVGQLKSDHTITAEIQRADVTVTIRFEVRVQDRKGYITYERFPTPNMKLRSEIHADFSALDPRIPPYEEYIDEDNRPYYNECLVFFRLRDDIEITDLSSNDPSIAGGDNGHGINIPPIFLPPAPIDLSGGSKVTCASRVPIRGPGEEESNSESTDSDDDQILRITQAIRKGEKIHVAVSGFFKRDQNMDSVVTFRQPYFGPPPDSLRMLFNIAHAAIEAMPPTLGSSGFPNALMWSKYPFTDADIDTVTTKPNDGLLVTFSRHDMPGVPISSFEKAYTLKLPSGLRISFGAEKDASDFIITGYLDQGSMETHGESFLWPDRGETQRQEKFGQLLYRLILLN
jgi:hypothetical protein